MVISVKPWAATVGEEYPQNTALVSEKDWMAPLVINECKDETQKKYYKEESYHTQGVADK